MAGQRSRGRALTAERIIEVATRICDEEDIDVLTIRRLAADLGVGAMTLYSYFRGKEEILDGIADYVMGNFRLPTAEETSPEAVKARNAVDRLPVVEVFRECGGRVALMAAGILSAGVASLIVLPFAWLALLQTRNYGLMLLGFTLLFIGYPANYGVVPAYFSQVFPARLRFTGMSIGFTVGLIAGNAFSPDIATYLLHTTGGWVGIAVYMAAMSAVSVVAGLFLREVDDTTEPSRAPAPHVAADSDTGDTAQVR
ncbi:TetR family transcriptional regulator [Streptomyces asiaticus]|uniref:TetR family transcriptional regulator n=1 Tax=Streptomyces asiaticus TaxID=114695 RepID=UPI0038273EA3